MVESIEWKHRTSSLFFSIFIFDLRMILRVSKSSIERPINNSSSDVHIVLVSGAHFIEGEAFHGGEDSIKSNLPLAEDSEEHSNVEPEDHDNVTNDPVDKVSNS